MLVALLVGAATLLALASSAFADVEPNDRIYQAEGPIAGGQSLSGTLSAAEDQDYYVFYVSGIQQIHLTAQGSPDDDCIRARLNDSDGANQYLDFTTPPGVNRLFVQIGRDNCSGDVGYTFRVDPATGVNPATAMVSGPSKLGILTLGEPNETAAQAIGPLGTGVWYAGSLDTQNDQDWMYFYTPPGTHQVDVTVTSQITDSCDTSLGLLTTASEYADLSTDPSEDVYRHLKMTFTGAGKHYLNIGDGLGCKYLVQLGPAESVTNSLVTTPIQLPVDKGKPEPKPTSKKSSSKCHAAKSSRKRWNKRISTTKRSISRTHSNKKKKALKKKLSAERRTLKRIVDRVTIYC